MFGIKFANVYAVRYRPDREWSASIRVAAEI